MLTTNSVPVDSLSRTIPLLIEQARGDSQVPYWVTQAAAQTICAQGTPVDFKLIDGGHVTPLTDGGLQLWARAVMSGESNNNCATLHG
jgi:hypothetical protein